MNDRQVAIDACEAAQKAHACKCASAYVDAFQAAEGQANAQALREEAGQRFKLGLSVLKEAHDSSLALVEQIFP